MLLLDENIINSQRTLLLDWKINVKQIGYELEENGIDDERIIPVLHKIKNVTFFTRDLGFYKKELCHTRYCLVVLFLDREEVATFVRKLLKHPSFDTNNKRMGKVIRLSHRSIRFHELNVEKENKVDWDL